MITFAEVLLLAADHADEAKLCVVCGEPATVRGLWLDEGWSTGPQLGVTAWCDTPECRDDMTRTKHLATAVPGEAPGLDVEPPTAAPAVIPVEERKPLGWLFRQGVPDA